MKKNILIINTGIADLFLLLDFFVELRIAGFGITLFSAEEKTLKQFRERKWPAKRIFSLPDPNGYFPFLFLVLISPLGIPACFVWLLFIKYSLKTKTIICCNWFEKIAVTPLAPILGIKVFWLEVPGFDYKKTNPFLLLLFKMFSRFAQIIVFTEYTKETLRKSGVTAGIIKIRLGIKLRDHKRQENIFTNIARATREDNVKRKYFTVGTIVKLNEKQKMEVFFQSIGKCLEVIPNLQVVVVGDGPERKNLIWLAKKMGIDNLVWFVGGEQPLRKWLDTFDIFVATGETVYLYDICAVTHALAAGVPVIAPPLIGFEDIIKDGDNGLISEDGRSENLAQNIINLYKNKALREKLSRNARDYVRNNSGIDKMAEKMKDILCQK